MLQYIKIFTTLYNKFSTIRTIDIDCEEQGGKLHTKTFYWMNTVIDLIQNILIPIGYLNFSLSIYNIEPGELGGWRTIIKYY